MHSSSQQQNILRKLVNRELYGHPPGASVNTVRKCCESLVPNATVTNCDLPAAHICRFSPDGQYLVCFASAFQQLVVYRYTGPAVALANSRQQQPAQSQPSPQQQARRGADVVAADDGAASTTQQPPTQLHQQHVGNASQSMPQAAHAANATILQQQHHHHQQQQHQHQQHPQVGNAGTAATDMVTVPWGRVAEFRRNPSALQLHNMDALDASNRPSQFDHFFRLLYRVSLCTGTTTLAKDFALFPLPGSVRPLLLVASHTPPVADPARLQQMQQVPDPGRAHLPAAVHTLPYVERTTLHLLELGTGQQLDSLSWAHDWVPLTGNAGASLHGELLAVTGVRSQEVQLLQVTAGGALRPVLQLGRWCREDDELTVQQAELAEARWQRQQQAWGYGRHSIDHAGALGTGGRGSVTGAKRHRESALYGSSHEGSSGRRARYPPSAVGSPSGAPLPAAHPHGNSSSGSAAALALRPAPLLGSWSGHTAASPPAGRMSLPGTQPQHPAAHVAPNRQSPAVQSPLQQEQEAVAGTTSVVQPGMQAQAQQPGLLAGGATAAASAHAGALTAPEQQQQQQQQGVGAAAQADRARRVSFGGEGGSAPGRHPRVSFDSRHSLDGGADAERFDSTTGGPPLIGGLKQKLLAFHMRSCLQTASASVGPGASKAARAAAKRAALRRFYADFDNLHAMMIWRAQLIDRHLLLLDMGLPQTSGDASSGPAAAAGGPASPAQPAAPAAAAAAAAGGPPGSSSLQQQQQQQGQYLALYDWRAARVRAFCPSTSDTAIRMLLRYARLMGSDATGCPWERYTHGGLHVRLCQELLQGLQPDVSFTRAPATPSPPLSAMPAADAGPASNPAMGPMELLVEMGEAAGQVLQNQHTEGAHAMSGDGGPSVAPMQHPAQTRSGAAALLGADKHRLSWEQPQQQHQHWGGPFGLQQKQQQQHAPVAAAGLVHHASSSQHARSHGPGEGSSALALTLVHARGAVGAGLPGSSAAAAAAAPPASSSGRASGGGTLPGPNAGAGAAQDRPAVMKRVLGLLPAGAQLVSASPLLDHRLFLYDDKLLTPVTRPRPLAEQHNTAIRFYLVSRPEQVAFKLEPGAGEGVVGPAGRQLRPVVTALFHPTVPLVMLLGGTVMGPQTWLTLHYRA